jgi:ABC-type multidrug transport system ATPase subunit
MIEANGLVKRYGSTAAVNDLSFFIRPGLVTGFLGPNGAGKTTTMLGVLCISSEYSSGMISTSLIAVPKRGRILAAKSLVFAALLDRRDA